MDNERKPTKQEQLDEAIERMKMLNLHQNTISELKDDNLLNMSEDIGILYWVEKDEHKILVKEFEIKYNAKVYHIIHNYTQFGELLSMLYVSDSINEWELDRNDIIENCPMAYVANVDDSLLSDIGHIGIKQSMGGLVRTD